MISHIKAPTSGLSCQGPFEPSVIVLSIVLVLVDVLDNVLVDVLDNVLVDHVIAPAHPDHVSDLNFFYFSEKMEKKKERWRRRAQESNKRLRKTRRGENDLWPWERVGIKVRRSGKTTKVGRANLAEIHSSP